VSRILVTGASGMLGAGVARALAARGDQVVVMQRRPSGLGLDEVCGDVSDPQAARRAVGGCEVVIHLAAKVSLSGSAAEFRRVNVQGTDTLLQAAAAAGVSRFVQVSSPSVAHAGAALVGAGAGAADPERARGHYARTKAQAELLALAADVPGFAVVAVRPHLVWGPGDEQLVARIEARARAGRLVVIGGGRALIDTTYLDNAVDAIVAAGDRAHRDGVHGEAFVVSNGEPRTVLELLTRIAAARQAPGPRRSVPYSIAWCAGWLVERLWSALRRPGEPPMTAFLAEQLSTAHWFDQRRTRDALEWAPRVSLDEGFARLAAH
jgi:nucleoside-diphosphate-sugar epimerase